MTRCEAPQAMVSLQIRRASIPYQVSGLLERALVTHERLVRSESLMAGLTEVVPHDQVLKSVVLI